MKALLIKDIITIWKQMKLMFLLILVFSVVSSTYQNIFAVVYASLIPYIAIAYDEKSKWNRMAAMMPYSVRDIVCSKYVLGLIFSAGTLILAVLIRFAICTVRAESFSAEMFVLGFIGAMLIMDISLPLMFRFGVEKGRAIMIFMIMLICGGTSAIAIVPEIPDVKVSAALAPSFLAAAVLTVLSARISSKMYLKHEN